jgi:hypothetical protein
VGHLLFELIFFHFVTISNVCARYALNSVTDSPKADNMLISYNDQLVGRDDVSKGTPLSAKSDGLLQNNESIASGVTVTATGPLIRVTVFHVGDAPPVGDANLTPMTARIVAELRIGSM